MELNIPIKLLILAVHGAARTLTLCNWRDGARLVDLFWYLLQLFQWVLKKSEYTGEAPQVKLHRWGSKMSSINRDKLSFSVFVVVVAVLVLALNSVAASATCPAIPSPSHVRIKSVLHCCLPTRAVGMLKATIQRRPCTDARSLWY